jgi:hypothetical protein
MNNSDQGEWLNQGAYQSKRDSRQKEQTPPLVRPPLRKELNLFDLVAIVVGAITDGWVPGSAISGA